MQEKAIIKDYIIFKDGEARIAEKTHLKAEIVARMMVNGESVVDEVMAHYGLTRAQVHAALTYYYENQQALDEAYDEFLQDKRVIPSSDLRGKMEANIAARQQSNNEDKDE